MDNNEEFKSTSPVPQQPAQPVTYLFFDAIKEVLSGRKITRAEWGNNEIYGVLKDGQLCIYGGESGDGIYHPWTLRDVDMLADDWILLPEGN